MSSAKKKLKKNDPISERAHALTDQIASLEAEIKRLDNQLQHTPCPSARLLPARTNRPRPRPPRRSRFLKK